jgi:hypothetical protein
MTVLGTRTRPHPGETRGTHCYWVAGSVMLLILSRACVTKLLVLTTLQHHGYRDGGVVAYQRSVGVVWYVLGNGL